MKCRVLSRDVMPRIDRRPSHAGSWYDNRGSILAKQIDEWMGSVSVEPGVHAQAIIAPHAGYRYCGHVMAHAYKQIDPSKVSRVFLLGPSHHIYTEKCVLSTAENYKTPLGDLKIDHEVCEKLRGSGLFEVMDMETDEAEHSLELHTPYIVKTMGDQDFTLVPIMVGVLAAESEAGYAQILGAFLDEPSNLFIISSDFCHWGSRFRYSLYDPAQGPIWKYIEWLDNEGMKAIETGEAKKFKAYLQKTSNTICGRHPISLFLNMLIYCQVRYKIEFKFYDQSSKCETQADSSVSYAAAIVTTVE